MATTFIPSSCMSGIGWGQATEVLSENERGNLANRVLVEPGGGLSVIPNAEAASQPLAVMPQGRMSSEAQ